MCYRLGVTNSTKIICLFLVSLLFAGCPQEDDGLVDNPEDILGTWFRLDFCDEQNQLILSSDNTYTWIQSENTDCNENTHFTAAFSGTFELTEIEIVFKPLDVEIIDVGENGITPAFELPNEEIWSIGFQNDTQFTAIIVSINGSLRDYEGPRLTFIKN